ncbi:MAG: methyltransferase domain-containing protein [Streptosporangiaceae bacterium]|nr:methyltransferase domain-containing protein [Streptosporangiaceae bacterium]
MAEERDLLDSYFAASEDRQRLLRTTKPSDARGRVLLKPLIPVRYRGTGRVILTDLVRPRERRKARLAAGQREVRLHLGCGGEPKTGWVNIDLLGDPVDVAWNLASPLPFDSGSVAAIFHEHLLEHLPLRAGDVFMQECYRVLGPGGILRVGVPDAGKLIRSYAGDQSYLNDLHPGRPTALLAVQELFYWHRHCAMFDAETLGLLFRASGFPDPRPREFGDTDLDQAPDTEHRRAETLYMEARKPASRS